jgi:hypothetical protein
MLSRRPLRAPTPANPTPPRPGGRIALVADAVSPVRAVHATSGSRESPLYAGLLVDRRCP